jgi:hypothetical protein
VDLWNQSLAKAMRIRRGETSDSTRAFQVLQTAVAVLKLKRQLRRLALKRQRDALLAVNIVALMVLFPRRNPQHHLQL